MLNVFRFSPSSVVSKFSVLIFDICLQNSVSTFNFLSALLLKRFETKSYIISHCNDMYSTCIKINSAFECVNDGPCFDVICFVSKKFHSVHLKPSLVCSYFVLLNLRVILSLVLIKFS